MTTLLTRTFLTVSEGEKHANEDGREKLQRSLATKYIVSIEKNLATSTFEFWL